MEISRSRSIAKPLKLLLSSSCSSSSFSKNPRFNRSFKTLTLAPSSLSCPPRLLSLISSFLHPKQVHQRRHNFSSLSLLQNQELDHRNDCYQDHLVEVKKEKQSRFIPVKAFFLCTSIDLRSLQSQNAFNVIPPNSRAANYIVLRYYDGKGDQQVQEKT